MPPPRRSLYLGITETTLLFHFWLQQRLQPENPTPLRNKNAEGWLYNTSGFYDRQQTEDSERMFIEGHDPTKADVFQNYFHRLMYEILPGADFFNANMWTARKEHEELVPQFYQSFGFGAYGGNGNRQMLEMIRDKRVLLISPFAPLMADQVHNGNFQRIHGFAPAKVVPYRYLYTFFNRGPHQNMLETVADEIQKIEAQVGDFSEIDVVVASCGAYSCLLLDHFYRHHGKDVAGLGRQLQHHFGISNPSKPLWAGIPPHLQSCYLQVIPDEYKPEGYERIERGCYW